MIRFRTISLLVCLLAIQANFAFPLTVISPSATNQSSEEFPDESDSDAPDQLPADGTELPAVVELELNLPDVHQAAVSATSVTESPLGTFAGGFYELKRLRI